MQDELNYLSTRVTKGLLTRRQFFGRAAALGVTVAAANSMLASAAKAAGPVKGGTMKLGASGGESTDTQDPTLTTSEVPLYNLRHWGETLVDVTETGDLDMRMAENVESSADAKKWIFKIRKDINFSNGKTMTPEDVLMTMQRHSSEDSQSGALGIMRGIENMSVDGENFVVELAIGNADLPYLMADYHLMIQPGGGFDDPGAGIGTGPYTIEFDEPGVRHGFKRRDDYWDSENRGHAEFSEQLVLNDATARTAALQSGQVNMINRVDPKVADLLGRSPNLTVKSVTGRGHYVFVMHTDTAPFDNNDLRLALKYAVNREEMVKKVLRGYGTIGNDMPINGSYPLFDDTIPQRAFSLEKAAEHYKKSGHDGSPIILRTADGAFPGAVDAAALFQQSAQAAGIPLEIKREPNDGYWSEVWNVQPFCMSYWSGRPVQDQMYSTAYLSTADWNETRFKVPEFDEMVLAARAEVDEAKRKEIYSKMGRMVRDDGGLILPMFNDFVDAVDNNVGGYFDDPNGALMNNKAPIKCWINS